MRTIKMKSTVEQLLAMHSKDDVEPMVLAMFNATPTPPNTPGIDGTFTLNGKTVKLEVKCHGGNMAHFGDIDAKKTLSENIKSLIKSDVYAFLRPQNKELYVMTSDEFIEWVTDRVRLEKSSKNNWKFRIGYTIRSKGRDAKIEEILA